MRIFITQNDNNNNKNWVPVTYMVQVNHLSLTLTNFIRCTILDIEKAYMNLTGH